MKVLGIIAEYNPFHYGHLYHLSRSREIVKPDYVIAIMSGNFTQRGEPALLDKWLRTQMALKNGIDIVIELPVSYACQSAELFALGGVQLLNSCNIITHMSFASEIGHIDPLYAIAKILVEEPDEYKNSLRDNLDIGHSYPTARNNALLTVAETLKMSKSALNTLLQSPNSILGIEYLKALIRTDSPIEPITFPRKASQYHDRNIKSNIASATAIRDELQSFGLSKRIEQVIPPICFEIMEDTISKNRGPVFIENLEQLILGTLRIMTPKQIASIMDVEEGLENRIKRCALDSSTITELLESVSTRRYVYTRIQRIFINTLLNNTTAKLKSYAQAGGPQYIRILGFRKDAQFLMGQLKKSAKLPIITKSAHFQREQNKLLKEMFMTDVLATDLYILGTHDPLYRVGGQDFKTPPIIVE